MTRVRRLVLVLGDQLSLQNVAFEGFDAAHDRVLMVEAKEESEHVPSTKMRTALFLSAMRHFAELLRERRWPLQYLRIGTHRFAGIADALADALAQHRPDVVVMTEAGEWRLEGRAGCDIPAGAAVVGVIRYEKLSIGANGGLPASVVEATYLGPTVRVTVRLESGRSLIAEGIVIPYTPRGNATR